MLSSIQSTKQCPKRGIALTPSIALRGIVYCLVVVERIKGFCFLWWLLSAERNDCSNDLGSRGFIVCYAAVCCFDGLGRIDMVLSAV